MPSWPFQAVPASSGTAAGAGGGVRLTGGAPSPWYLPPCYRARAYPDPEGTFHGDGPGVQAEAPEAVNLGFLVHHRCAAGQQNAPPGPGLAVIVVGLERDQALFPGCGELRPAGRAEDHV